jgi:hypothetical protein
MNEKSASVAVFAELAVEADYLYIQQFHVRTAVQLNLPFIYTCC